MKVIIEVDQSDPTQTIIKNDNGDTYTFSNPEEFNDFIYGSKKLESSSRIIHSQPQDDAFYWVKCFFKGEYEVARCQLKIDGEYWFKFTDGGIKEVKNVSDWKREPIQFNEAYYG